MKKITFIIFIFSVVNLLLDGAGGASFFNNIESNLSYSSSSQTSTLKRNDNNQGKDHKTHLLSFFEMIEEEEDDKHHSNFNFIHFFSSRDQILASLYFTSYLSAIKLSSLDIFTPKDPIFLSLQNFRL